MNNNHNLHRKIKVEYVSKDSIYPAFVYARNGIAIVRNDLPPRVQNFVVKHELYHLRDTHEWGGWIGKEIRANVKAGLHDPIGLLATTKASLHKERLKFYVGRFKNGE